MKKDDALLICYNLQNSLERSIETTCNCKSFGLPISYSLIVTIESRWKQVSWSSICFDGKRYTIRIIINPQRNKPFVWIYRNESPTQIILGNKEITSKCEMENLMKLLNYK